jgi:hypothetical protein
MLGGDPATSPEFDTAMQLETTWKGYIIDDDSICEM